MNIYIYIYMYEHIYDVYIYIYMYKMFKSVIVSYSSSLCLVMCCSNLFFISRRHVQALCCNRTCSKSEASFPRP